KSIIIASGGYGGLYNNFTTNSTATTGEILHLALDIGCELENLEFVQFHPTSLKQNRILISESARGEGGYLVDQHGDRFIDELKPRDEVSRAIYEKIQNGDQVFLDLRHLGLEKIQESMPQEYNLAYQFTGLKFDEHLIEITPSAHYTMGGIRVNLDAKTNIQNLYACGECASNRVHGANRLGGNSLLEIITFGRVAGKNASFNTTNITQFDTTKYQNNIKETHLNIDNIYTLPNKINFQNIKKELGKMLFSQVGLFRDAEQLSSLLEQLKMWEAQLLEMGIEDKSKIYNTDLKEFLEFQNMIKLSIALVLSALHRKESRGAHYRTDYLKENRCFQTSTIVVKENGEIKVKKI
ncbi:MAG: FAD-binding protein, partial [Arcobacteraceae bacterium]